MNARPSLSNGLRIGAACLTAALLSACGGHSGSSLPSTKAGNSQTALVKFDIVVPPKSATSAFRKPSYVSTSTDHATLSVTQGATTVTAAATCAAGHCAGTIAAPIGVDLFSASLFDTANELLSQTEVGGVPFTVVAGHANTVPLTFNPAVAAVSFIPNPAAALPTFGTAGTVSLLVRAEDAAGNIITGPGHFVSGTGQTLTFGATVTNDAASTAYGAVTGTAASPGDLITVAYTGGSPVFGATLTPTVATGPGTLPGTALHPTSVAPIAATAAQVTETDANGSPVGIAVDPVTPANIWYAGRAGGISLVGSGTPLTGTGPFPFAVAAGGTNLWFADWGIGGTADQPSPAAIYKVDANAPTSVAATYALPTLPTSYENAVPTSILFESTGGLVWFAQRGFVNGGTAGLPPSPAVSAIGNFNPGTLTFNEINVPGNPYGIVKGPDGNIWFTEDWNDKVGFLPTSATAGATPTEFALSGFASPFAEAAKGIATDGTSLWVARQSSDQIAKVTTAGDVTLYALSPGAAPVNIIWVPALGGTGRLVFTESGTGRIGILDPAKATEVQPPSYTGPVTTGLTEIQLPNGVNSAPLGLVAAGDGSIWVTEARNGVAGGIAHITVF